MAELLRLILKLINGTITLIHSLYETIDINNQGKIPLIFRTLSDVKTSFKTFRLEIQIEKRVLNIITIILVVDLALYV